MGESITSRGESPPALPRPGRYLRRLAAGALALWALMAAWTLVVDPYGLFRWVEWPGFNDLKSPPYRVDQILHYLEHEPELVVFGSSRVKNFVGPLQQRFGERAMAYGLPGMKMRELLPTLRFLHARVPLRRVVIGLDFFAFNAAASVHPPNYARLDRLFWVDFLFRNVLSWDVFREGIRVAARNIDAGARAAESGREARIEALREGRAADAEVRRIYVQVVGNYLDRSYYGSFAFDEAAAAGLEAELARLQADGARVQLFISPPHATLLATLRLLGAWPAYEEFHRRLLSLAEARGLELWDFAAVEPLSGEPVGGGMQWFADPSHYRAAFARLILQRLEGETPEPPVGVRLAPAMLEAHLAAKRAELDHYLAAHPEVVELVRQGARSVGLDLPARP